MQFERDKGLYFNNNENFHKNYKCKAKFLVLLIEQEDEIGENSQVIHEIEHLSNQELGDVGGTISYNALNGDLVPRILRFKGIVNNTTLSILVDSGVLITSCKPG